MEGIKLVIITYYYTYNNDVIVATQINGDSSGVNFDLTKTKSQHLKSIPKDAEHEKLS